MARFENQFDVGTELQDQPEHITALLRDLLPQPASREGATGGSDRLPTQNEMLIAFMGEGKGQKERTYTKEDLRNLGPNAGKFIEALGVESLKIEQTADGQKLSLKLKDVVKRAPEEDDEFSRMFFQKDVSAVITREKDGTIVLDKIKGMTAQTDTIIGTFTGRIHHMEIREVNGQTEIKTTATVKKLGRDREHEAKPKIKPLEYKQKADLLLDKLQIQKQ